MMKVLEKSARNNRLLSWPMKQIEFIQNWIVFARPHEIAKTVEID